MGSDDRQKKVATLVKDKGVTKDTSAEEQAKITAEIAKGLGYDFTAEELLEEVQNAQKDKMDMNEFDAVAGGGFTFLANCFVTGTTGGKKVACFLVGYEWQKDCLASECHFGGISPID